MFKLNLLPPKDKKRLELIDFSYLLVYFGFRLVIVFIIFILILITTYFSLFILVNSQEGLIGVRQSNENAQLQMEIEKKIEETNKDARQLYVKQSEIIVWTPILEKLSKITPDGIYLTSFSYLSIDDKVNIVGWAENRDKLLSFKDSLEEIPYFKDVYAPLSNLIKQTDINFNFTLKSIE